MRLRIVLILGLILVFAALSGCATYTYKIPVGVARETAEREYAACRFEAMRGAGGYYSPGDGWTAVMMKEALMDACMRAHGYVKEISR